MKPRSKSPWMKLRGTRRQAAKRITPGCAFCYAYTLAEDKRGTPAFPNGFDLTIRPHKLKEPFRLKSPTLIFVNSMSDLFWDQIPKSYAGVNYFLSSGVDYSRSPVADCSTVGPGTSSRDCLVRSRRSLTGICALGPLKSDSSLNLGRFWAGARPFPHILDRDQEPENGPPVLWNLPAGGNSASTRPTISRAERFNALASFRIVVSVGCCWPSSRMLIYVLRRSASSPSSS
jgi:Protein of unknown function (DUF5131)